MMNQPKEQAKEEQVAGQQKLGIGALHLTNLAVVPGVNVTCDINNSYEAQAIKDIYNRQEKIVLVSGKNGSMNISKEDLFEYCCIARIDKVQDIPNGGLKASVVGEKRAKITDIVSLRPLVVNIQEIEDINVASEKSFQKMNDIKKKCKDASKFDRYFPPEVEAQILYNTLIPAQFADALIHLLVKNINIQQQFLSEPDVEKRLDIISEALDKFVGSVLWRKQIDDKVNANFSKNQKEMFLREQLHVINDELNGEVDEIEEMRKKVKALKLSQENEEKVLKEVNRLSKLPFGSPEVGYIRSFIETVLELPWSERTEDNLDLEQAKKVLNKDHYALDKVKERILETLAVIKLTGKVSGQIICFVGPPGVGKTSIARSIATAMGRKFVQVALGGVSDESVIRGHRRTYVGAMCGRILAGMKQAKTVNPVFLLDEIDKLTKDIKGDPSSALLEVLDAEQNNHFKDNFLELPYDLSQVLFILTANTLENIPKPLLDRMEVIELRSYTEIEKIYIAQRHLIPKQEELCGLKKGTIPFTKEILSRIISEYTYEAGVRNLERAIAGVCRKYVTFEVGGVEKKELTVDNLPDFLGNEFIHEADMFQGGNIGEVVGLSVTSVGVGGTLLIEATVIEGDEKITLTGKQGQLMKESTEAAYSLVKSMAGELGIDRTRFAKSGLHIHIPHASNGVEGPSAGIAATTAIVSAYLQKKVKPHLAMTGEVSLRGRVLAIGGIRDKLIAATRVGVKTVIVPKDNEKDLKDLPEEVRKMLEIHLVQDIREVLTLALD